MYNFDLNTNFFKLFSFTWPLFKNKLDQTYYQGGIYKTHYDIDVNKGKQ